MLKNRDERAMEELNFFPSVGDTRRVIPNDLIRSSLFTISNHKMPRLYFKANPLYTFGETAIVYTGEELRQDDEDVWMQLIHHASKARSNHIEFMPYTMMRELEWPRRTQYRDKLKSILVRLSATNIAIRNKALHAGLSLSLIRKFTFTDESGSPMKKWKVWLEPEIVNCLVVHCIQKLIGMSASS